MPGRQTLRPGATDEQKVAAHRAKAEETGRKPHGPEAKPPKSSSRKNEQVNLTDEESRILPLSGKRFEQVYNASSHLLKDDAVIAPPSALDCYLVVS